MVDEAELREKLAQEIEAEIQDYAGLNVNYGACQISDHNAFGAMLVRDAKYGYTGGYIVDEYGNEVDE